MATQDPPVRDNPLRQAAQEWRSQELGPFIQAMNEYTSSLFKGGMVRYPEQGLDRAIDDAGAIRYAEGAPGVPLGSSIGYYLMRGAARVLQNILGEIGGGPEAEVVGREGQTRQTPMDVTDPALDVSGMTLNATERRLRLMNVWGKVMEGAVVTPMPGSTSGIQRLIDEGELAPPSSPGETAIHFLAPMMVGFAAFGGPGAAMKTIAPAFTKGLGAAAAAREAARYAGATGSVAGQGVRRALTMAGKEAAIGAGFGVAETALYEGGIPGVVPGLGHDLSATDKAMFIGAPTAISGLLGLLGGSVGAFFATRTELARRNYVGSNAAVLYSRYNLPVFKGDEIIAGRRVTQVTKGEPVKWEWVTGPNVGKEAPPPSLTELDEHASLYQAWLERQPKETPQQQAELGLAPPAAAAEPAPGTPPPSPIPETFDRKKAESWIGPQMGWALNLTREGKLTLAEVERRMAALRVVFSDATQPPDVRTLALARMQAFEYVRGQLTQTGAGKPLNDVVTAHQIVTAVYEGLGGEAAENAIKRLELDQPGAAQLARQMIAGLGDQKMPERIPTDVLKHLDSSEQKAARRQNVRGYRKNQHVVYQGRQYKLRTPAEYGFAMGEAVDDPMAPQVRIDLTEATPIPHAGDRYKLTDGRVVRVYKVKGDKFDGKVIDAVGRELDDLTELPLGSLLEPVSTPEVSGLTAEHLAAGEALLGDKVTEVPSTRAVSTSGESLNVTGVGEKTVEVTTPQGTRKRMPKSQVRSSSKQQKPKPTVKGPATAAEAEAESKAVMAVKQSDAELAAVADDSPAMTEPVKKYKKARAKAAAKEAEVKAAKRAKEPMTSETLPARPPRVEIGPEIRGRLDITPEEALAVAQGETRGTTEAGVPVATPEFEPGTLPEMDHRGLFTMVTQDQARMIDAAVKKGKKVSRVWGQKVQLHVLPQQLPGKNFALYYVEVPPELKPKLTYMNDAKAALGALKRGDAKTHKSTVIIDADDLNEGVRFIRVSDDLVAGAVRTDDALVSMTPEEQTAYLRRLLVLADNVQTETAVPAAQARVAQREVAAALKTKSGLEAQDAQVKQAEGNVKAAEAAVAVKEDVGRQASAAKIARVKQSDRLEPFRREFQAEGIKTKAGLRYFLTLVAEMPPTAGRAVPPDELMAIHTVQPVRALISKRVRMTSHIRPHGVRVPTAQVYYAIREVWPQGKFIRGAPEVELDTPEGVLAWLLKNKYTPTDLTLSRTTFSNTRSMKGESHVVAYVARVPSGEIAVKVRTWEPTSGERAVVTPERTKGKRLIQEADEKQIAVPELLTDEELAKFSQDPELVEMMGLSEQLKTVKGAEPEVVALTPEQLAAGQALLTAADTEGKPFKVTIGTNTRDADGTVKMRPGGVRYFKTFEEAETWLHETGLQADGYRYPPGLDMDAETVTKATTVLRDKARLYYEAYAASGENLLAPEVLEAQAAVAEAWRVYEMTTIGPDGLSFPYEPLSFNTLPPTDIALLTPEIAEHVHSRLQAVLTGFRRFERGELPDGVAAYAREFADGYHQITGKVPFNLEVREMLTWVTTDDLYHLHTAPPARARAQDIRMSKGTHDGADFHIKEDVDITPAHNNLYADVKVGPAPVEVSQLRAALMYQQEHFKLSQWGPKVAKLLTRGNADEGLRASTAVTLDERVFVEYRPSKTPVEVLEDYGIDLMTAGHAKIKFPDGSIMDVPTSDLAVHGPRQPTWMGDYLWAQEIADGHKGIYATRQPEIGFHDVEQSLGVLGSRDPQIVSEAFLARTLTLMDRISRRMTSAKQAEKLLAASSDELKELLGLYRRATWLELPTPREYPIKQKLSEAMLSLIPEKQRKAFLHAVYRSAKDEFGGSPMGELKAQALSEQMFETRADPIEEAKRVKQLAAIKTLKSRLVETGLVPPNAPVWAVLEAAEQHQLAVADPMVRNWMKNLSSAVGLAAVSMALSDPTSGLAAAGFIMSLTSSKGSGGPYLRITMPDVSLSQVSYYLGLPAKIALKHPLTQMVYSSVMEARVKQQLFIKHNGSEALQSLEQLGVTNDEFLAARRLLGEYKTWAEAEAAMKSGKVDWKGARVEDPGSLNQARVAQSYHLFKDMFQYLKKELIKVQLLRGTKVIPYEPKNASHRLIVENRGLNPDAVIQGGFLRVSNIDQEALKARGLAVPEALQIRTYAEIDRYMHWLETFDDGAALPKEATKQDRWEFNFWKNHYGYENFWPLVQSGELRLHVMRDGKDLTVGWVSNVGEAMRSMGELRDQGLVGANEDVFIKPHQVDVDEAFLTNLTEREQAAVAKDMLKIMSYNPDEVRGLAIRYDHQGKPFTGTQRPTLWHAESRKAWLNPIIADPRMEYMTYVMRIADAKYKNDVYRISRLLNNETLDVSLSRNAGVEPLTSAKAKRLRQWTIDWLAKAVGEQNGFERMTDQVIGFAASFGHTPVLAAQKAFGTRGTEKLPWSFVVNPFERQPLYHRKYAGRMLASRAVGLQALWRLGLTPGSVAANLTQYWMNTLPLLMDEGIGALQAGKIATSAWKDGVSLWYHLQSPKRSVKLAADLKKWVPIADELGITTVVGRDLGGGSTDWIASQAMPLRLGRSLGQYSKEMAQYMAMYAFNGAEKVNRFATMIAAYKKASIMYPNMSEAAKMEFARRFIAKTQFNYDELSLPLAMQAFGPAGRVAFQFKTYLVNALTFEKDLLVRAARNEPAARKQLAAHLGMVMLVGGAYGLTNNPWWSLMAGAGDMVGAPMKELGLTPDGVAAHGVLGFGGQDDRQRDQTFLESQAGEAPQMFWKDILNYGAAGVIFNSAVGQRLGIAGQELIALGDFPDWLGPHLSVYMDYVKMLNEYRKLPGTGPAVAGAVAGAVLSGLLPKATPFRGMAGSMAGAMIGSYMSDNPLLTLPLDEREDNYLMSSDAGNRFRNRASPTLARNIVNYGRLYVGDWDAQYTASERASRLLGGGVLRDLQGVLDPNMALDMYDMGALRDLDGKPMWIPGGKERLWELISLGVGFPSIRRTEYNATINYELGDAPENQALHMVLVDQVARARLIGDDDEVMRLLWSAMEQGIPITDEQVQAKMKRLSDERIATERQSIPAYMRRH